MSRPFFFMVRDMEDRTTVTTTKMIQTLVSSLVWWPQTNPSIMNGYGTVPVIGQWNKRSDIDARDGFMTLCANQ